MRKLCLALLGVILGATSVSAQPHPCDLPPMASATVLVGQTFTFTVCHDFRDTAGQPIATMAEWRMYRNDVLTPATVTVGAVANAAGLRAIDFAGLTEAVPGTVTYQFSAVATTAGQSAEGPRSSPFPLSVAIPQVPRAPSLPRVTVP